jgi:hypothetical protein
MAYFKGFLKKCFSNAEALLHVLRWVRCFEIIQSRHLHGPNGVGLPEITKLAQANIRAGCN